MHVIPGSESSVPSCIPATLGARAYFGYDGMARFYDAWVGHMPEVTEPNRAFYLRHYLEAKSGVVELGVGNGRILIPAARAGIDVVGIEKYDKMRSLCLTRAAEAGVLSRIKVHKGEFDDFRIKAPVGLISIPYDALGHLITREAVKRCFLNIHRQLRPEGLFIFDTIVSSPRMIEQDRIPSVFGRVADWRTGRNRTLWSVTEFDHVRTCRRSFVWSTDTDDEAVPLESPHTICIDNAVFALGTLPHLLRESGFRLVSTFGDFEGGPLTSASSYQVYVARR